MNQKLEQAKKEGRLLEFEGRNGEDYPLLIAIDRANTQLVHAPEDTPSYEIHMLTRHHRNWLSKKKGKLHVFAGIKVGAPG